MDAITRGRMLGLLALLVVGGIFVMGRTAHADPHAMFYTAVGQRQLFFNFLAALDQADYVEPATGTFGRDQLLDRRNQAGFGPEQDDRATATSTNLSSILTRGITLEGNDLWSAYLLHQFSVEVARRNATDEVIRVYCERGLALPGCASDTTAQLPNEAFITDPRSYGSQVTQAGEQVLLSGLPEDQEYRKEKGKPDAPFTGIRPYDEFVAELHSNTAGSEDIKQTALRSVISNVSSAGGDPVDPNVFEGLTVDNQNKVSVADAKSPDDITSKLAGVFGLPNQLLMTRMRAQGYASEFQAAQRDGSLGGVQVKANPEESTSGATQYKAIEGRLTTPPEAREGTLHALANTIGTMDQNLQHAVPEAESVPGQVEAVDRPRQGGGGAANLSSLFNGSTPAVAGVTSEGTGSSSGQVKGIFTDLLLLALSQFYQNYDNPVVTSERLSADANLVAPHLEDGSRSALVALTDGTYRKNEQRPDSCGFCVGLNWIILLIKKILCNVFGIGCS